jgi:hypothetical protein
MGCAAFRTRRARDSAARWRSDRRGGGRRKAAGGGGGAAVRLRTFAIARAPPASTLSLTSAAPTSSLIHLFAAVFHAQLGWTPLHKAAIYSSSVAVVQALLATYPEAAMATDTVRRPSPLAAWMRGPERSSEVIICNQGQSGVIIRNQRALSGTQRPISGTQSHSVATRWAPQRPSAGPSEAIRGTQRLIRGDQRYSEALRGHQRPLRATQSHAVAFSGTQRHSAALRGTQRALGTRSSPPFALRSASKHPVLHICPTHVVAHPCCCVPRTERVLAPSRGRSWQLIGGGVAGAPRGVPGGRHGDDQCTPPLPPCRVDERP